MFTTAFGISKCSFCFEVPDMFFFYKAFPFLTSLSSEFMIHRSRGSSWPFVSRIRRSKHRSSLPPYQSLPKFVHSSFPHSCALTIRPASVPVLLFPVISFITLCRPFYAPFRPFLFTFLPFSPPPLDLPLLFGPLTCMHQPIFPPPLSASEASLLLLGVGDSGFPPPSPFL